MALPTNDHVRLREWLATRGVEAHELAGALLVDATDALLGVAGSAWRLGANQLVALAEARSRAEAGLGWMAGPSVPAAGEDEVRTVLNDVCEALAAAGVHAVPFEGIGVVFGGEVLFGQVMIREPEGLYARMPL